MNVIPFPYTSNTKLRMLAASTNDIDVLRELALNLISQMERTSQGTPCDLCQMDHDASS